MTGWICRPVIAFAVWMGKRQARCVQHEAQIRAYQLADLADKTQGRQHGMDR